jgi:hypothetical protein
MTALTYRGTSSQGTCDLFQPHWLHRASGETTRIRDHTGHRTGADDVGGPRPLACRASVRWGWDGLASKVMFIARRSRPSLPWKTISASGTSKARRLSCHNNQPPVRRHLKRSRTRINVVGDLHVVLGREIDLIGSDSPSAVRMSVGWEHG